MARNGNLPITDRILAIRERWHTKRHPFFLAFGEGKLPLRALGRYQALHYHFVSRALASFGLLYARGYHFEDVRKMIAENIAPRISARPNFRSCGSIRNIAGIPASYGGSASCAMSPIASPEPGSTAGISMPYATLPAASRMSSWCLTILRPSARIRRAGTWRRPTPCRSCASIPKKGSAAST